MTRGVYSNPTGARGVLAVLGGDACAACRGSGFAGESWEKCAACRGSGKAPAARPAFAPIAIASAATPRKAPAAYRGRCGNGSHLPLSVGRGKQYRIIEEGSDGCSNEAAEGGPPAGVSWSVAAGLRHRQRTGEWPTWFAGIVAPDGSGVPDRFAALARDIEPVSNPLRLCKACLARQDAASRAPVVERRERAVVMPALCAHGQREGVCGTCG